MEQQICAARLIPGFEMATAKFPSSFYAVDVHRAFNFNARAGGLPLETQFEQLFRLRLKPSTYYDHKARWFHAPRDARDKAVAAGYTEDGEYSRFLARHAAKDAKVKEEKRQHRAAISGCSR